VPAHEARDPVPSGPDPLGAQSSVHTWAAVAAAAAAVDAADLRPPAPSVVAGRRDFEPLAQDPDWEDLAAFIDEVEPHLAGPEKMPMAFFLKIGFHLHALEFPAQAADLGLIGGRRRGHGGVARRSRRQCCRGRPLLSSSVTGSALNSSVKVRLALPVFGTPRSSLAAVSTEKGGGPVPICPFVPDIAASRHTISPSAAAAYLQIVPPRARAEPKCG